MEHLTLAEVKQPGVKISSTVNPSLNSYGMRLYRYSGHIPFAKSLKHSVFATQPFKNELEPSRYISPLRDSQ